MATKYTHKTVAEKLEELKQKQEERADISERELAKSLDIPRTTLQHWKERQENIDEDDDVVAFFTSPAGVAFLHRLLLALHFVLVQCQMDTGRKK